MTVMGESGAAARPPGFVRVFVKTLALMLLFGIVGPLFLIAYVVIDQPMTGWMLYTGIGITAADVILAVVITVVRARGTGRMTRLEATGLLAQADIVRVEQTTVQVNDQPIMKLSLKIHGDGVEPFEATKKLVVPLMFLSVVDARRLVVLVEPGTRDYLIDWQRSALVSGSMPAVFTSVEDGETYDLSGRSEPLMRILKILKDNGIRLDGAIDLRDHPQVRGQVMEVVRQAAATAPGASTGADVRSVGQRLGELEDLRVSKAITESEYATMRARILKSL